MKEGDGMRIYNTLTNSLEEFKPVEPGKVKMYVCGPTTYNYIHIGNARPVIFFDTVRRYFMYAGYDVTFASNLTDLNDKIYLQSLKENSTELAIAKKYSDAYLEDVVSLHSLLPDVTPRVTEYIDEIVDYVQKLIDCDAAYISQGDVYFRVNKVQNYGKLSGQKLDDLITGARVQVNEKKENPLDFMLWKHNTDGEIYDAPYGNGRPGWHTECSCMIDDIFKGQIDIHGGGSDLRFPHHENEMAQSYALHNHSLANYWMHNGRIDLNQTKMSKSLGNMVLVRELLDKFDANAYRLFVLAHSYRSPVNYTEEQMEMYQKEYEKLVRATKQLFLELDLMDGFDSDDRVDSFIEDLHKNMQNDFGTANVVTSLYALLKDINISLRQKKTDRYAMLYNTLKDYYEVLGVVIPLQRLSVEDKAHYLDWLKARQEKDYAKADEFRAVLQERGILS